MRAQLFAVLAFTTLCGCAVGPNYKRPPVPVPAQFRGSPAAEPVSLGDSKWQTLFNDPDLTRIVTLSLENNFDLRIAVEHVEEARAQLGIVRANQFPFLDAEAGFTATRGRGISSSYTTLGPALSWEVDLWGRIRRLTEAARAQYLASVEGRHAVTVSLVAEVMTAYLQLLEQDLELDVDRRTTGIAADSIRLVELRHSRGAASALDVRQAEQLRFTATAAVAASERNIAQTENALSLLQGTSPGVQQRGRKLEEITVPPQLPAGLPSALLARRPDIREAEQNLIAANAQIGAARALYFPQISLTAFVGTQSVYSVAPAALESIFHAGQIRNQVRFTEAQQREMLIAYQRAIYTAFRETSDALVGFDKTREQRDQQEHLVATLTDTVRLSQLRYRGGLDSFLQVLDAQRNLFSAQLTLAQLQLQERLSVVQLYRALGGGWS